MIQGERRYRLKGEKGAMVRRYEAAIEDWQLLAGSRPLAAGPGGRPTPPAQSAPPGHQWSSDRANSRCGSSRSSAKFVTPPKVEISVSKLIELNVIIQRAEPPVRHPLRRLRAIPRDNLLGQIDEGAQARSHVAASWIIEAISGIRGRPLV
jgi:hypothetical protein